MEINTYIDELQKKYNYSFEMIQFLQKAIPTLISYYGEEKKDLILDTLSDCEIHIQLENENSKEFLNKYFDTNKEWDIPFLAVAFQHTDLQVKDNKVKTKSIIYIKTQLGRLYKPFDFENDSKISGIIHEICHAIKGYGKVKLEDGQVVTQTGLSKDYYSYDQKTNSFTNVRSTNTGLEEALNSYEEAEIMTQMTGVFHEFGAYEGMTQVARILMSHPELANVIRKSQFDGNDEWIEFLGKNDAEFLATNFEDWINVLYCSPSEILNDKENLIKKKNMAMDNVVSFARNYTTANELKSFEEARKTADMKTMEIVKQVINYNNQTNSFEQVQDISERRI